MSSLASAQFKASIALRRVRPRVQDLTLAPDCLKKNTFKEERCQGVIDALYECCQAFYDRNGQDAKAASCPQPDLLKLKLRMRKKKDDKA
ncbi:Cx9C motif-containing protein 4, mitochondrial [Cytospora mali]|uniref:Cx9C motif-containing protein 4, mitochondrial n=1 Tax=Cytospora mali TaxID=578113 RepID=A0A194VRN4_CYTMA|nr:Cx9C motif-containing protein 4, mitochondrial [Valsa mali]